MIRTKVIFLCTGNSARSQMAEGWLRHLSGDHIEPLSAGLDPKGLNPYAVEAMREVGIDISGHTSDNVTGLLGRPIQFVITVCDNAQEKCPIFPFAYKYLHWSVPDPAAVPDGPDKWRAFREARDVLRTRVETELIPLLPKVSKTSA
jgi:arsenate reductase